MLRITIPPIELWDEKKEEFVRFQGQTLQLEHSLVSISKWEAKYNKAFLSKEEKTYEETVDYIRFMTLTQNVDPSVYNYLTNENIKQINQYIEAPMTAAHLPKDPPGTSNREPVISELIYYWMIAFGIPWECQKWHLNRLMTLIRVCDIKNRPPKKMSRREIMSRNAALNAERRRRLNTRG